MFHTNYKFNHNFAQLARESNFNFREPNGNNTIDWRWIGSLDVDRISADRDFERIESTFNHITEISLGILLNNSLLDPAVGKYFTISQLCIQYLLFCIQFLDKAIVEMRMATIEGQKENLRLQKLCKKRDNELLQLHKKFQRVETQPKTVYPCTKCTKNFVSYEMLNVHITRKHSNDIETLTTINRTNPGNDANLINTIKLELEIKQLKEKLNNERELNEQKKIIDYKCNCCENTKLKEKQFHNIGIQNNLEEIKDKDDKEMKIEKNDQSQNLINLKKLFTKQEETLENWKKSEQLKYENEIKLLRDKLTITIDEFKTQTKELVEKGTNLVTVEKIDSKNDDDIWKDRFIKLEKIYFENQDVMFKSLKELDFKYNETMKNIEKQRNIEQKEEIFLRKEEIKKPTGHYNRMNVLSRNESINQESSLESSIEDEEDDDESIEIEIPVKSKDNLKTKNIQNINIEKLLSKNVSKPIIKSTVPIPIQISKPAIQLTKQSSINENEQKQRPKANKISFETTKQDVEKLYKNRLRELGIEPDWTDLPTTSMNSALSLLAQKRETNKKKFKSYFITRNKLAKTVDQMAKEILEPNYSKDIKSKIPVAKILKKKEPTLPSTSKELFIDDEISVQLELPPKPLLRTKTFVIQENPIASSTPLQSPNSLNSEIGMYNDDDESSGLTDAEIETDLMIKPKPVPRKRVIFDLDKKQKNEIKVNEVLEDVSDWESLNSDK